MGSRVYSSVGSRMPHAAQAHRGRRSSLCSRKFLAQMPSEALKSALIYSFVHGRNSSRLHVLSYTCGVSMVTYTSMALGSLSFQASACILSTCSSSQRQEARYLK